MDNVKINPETGCWEWARARQSRGYGLVRYNGKQRPSHRVSYELWNGPIPDGHYVLHHCDNPTCIKPDHLFTGTQSDNLSDCSIKGRNSKKLTIQQVEQIRNSTEVMQRMAERLGVSYTTIWNVRTRKIFKYV